jgi:hypothetical protein
LVAVVFVAVGLGIGALVRRGGSSKGLCDGSVSGGSAQAAIAAVVGPGAGVDVSSYIRERRTYLKECSDARPGQRVVGIVSLTGSANPIGAAALVGRVSIVAAYVRLPGGAPRTLPVPEPLALGMNQAPAIAAGYATLAGQLEQDAVSRPTAAETDQQQVAALRQDCGCVYAVAVAAPLRTLARLAQNDAVRLVDLAPLGFELDRISARPLLPSEIVVLEPSGAPGVFTR